MRPSQSSLAGRPSSTGSRLSRLSVQAVRLSQECAVMSEPLVEAPSPSETPAETPVSPRGAGLLEPRYAPPKEALNAAGAVMVKATAHVISLSDIDSREQQFECLLWLQVRRRGAACRGAPAQRRERGAPGAAMEGTRAAARWRHCVGRGARARGARRRMPPAARHAPRRGSLLQARPRLAPRSRARTHTRSLAPPARLRAAQRSAAQRASAAV
jgi:hypothetical protein